MGSGLGGRAGSGGDGDDGAEGSWWLYATFFLLTMAQALPLTAIQVLLNRDLGLQSRPEAVNRYFAVEFSMSMLKPVYAALSDFCPVMGRRRVPYMAFGGAAYAVVLQLYARVTTVDGLYAAGITSVVFYAVCETGADGMLVQLCGGDPKRSMKLQATGMLVRSAGSFLATVMSIPLLMAVSARALISLAGLLSLAAAAAACYVPEPKVRPTARDAAAGSGAVNTSNNGNDGNGGRAGAGAGGWAVMAGRLDGWTVGGVVHTLRGGAARGVNALRPCFTPRMGRAATFLFVYRLMVGLGGG